MEDLSILRRTVCWNLEQRLLPAVPAHGMNRRHVHEALETAYREFFFVTAEVLDREEVIHNAERLVEDMMRPAIDRLNTGNGGYSEDREVSAMLREIVGKNPIGVDLPPVRSTPNRGI